MSSYDYGKPEVCQWIRKTIHLNASILDVGACDGKWRKLLPEYPNMDAVEAYKPNAIKLEPLYRKVYNRDIYGFQYDWYDFIILGDVLEHLTVEQAQDVLAYSEEHSDNILISVPYKYEQGALYNNPYEVHKQPDLTAEIFKERYPGYKVLMQPVENYCYYVRKLM